MPKHRKKLPKETSEMSRRFIATYNNIPGGLQPFFLEDFSKRHNVKISTAKSRVYGYSDVTQWELVWAEGYNPYTRKSKADEVELNMA